MGGGVSVFNLTGAAETLTDLDDAVAAVQAMYASFKSHIPPAYTVKVNNTVEVREEDSGDLITVVTAAPVTATTGTTGFPAHAAGVGGRLRWQTAGITRGRRVVGTTFMIPMLSGDFDADGTLLPASQTALTTVGSALLGALNAAGLPLGVWSRPSSAGGTDGVLHPVVGLTVPDKASWLTSRRQ